MVYQLSRYYHNDNNKMIISREGRKVNIFILKLLYIYYLFFYVVVDKYAEAIEDKYVEEIVEEEVGVTKI